MAVGCRLEHTTGPYSNLLCCKSMDIADVYHSGRKTRSVSDRCYGAETRASERIQKHERADFWAAPAGAGLQKSIAQLSTPRHKNGGKRRPSTAMRMIGM